MHAWVPSLLRPPPACHGEHSLAPDQQSSNSSRHSRREQLEQQQHWELCSCFGMRPRTARQHGPPQHTAVWDLCCAEISQGGLADTFMGDGVHQVSAGGSVDCFKALPFFISIAACAPACGTVWLLGCCVCPAAADMLECCQAACKQLQGSAQCHLISLSGCDLYNPYPA